MKGTRTIKRRDFIKYSAVGFAGLQTFGTSFLIDRPSSAKSKVALVKTESRTEGVREVMKLVDFASAKGKHVLIKPNFNTADATPGSTHNDTLSQLIHEFRQRSAADITIGERSGPPKTEQVMKDKGIFQLKEDLNFNIVN